MIKLYGLEKCDNCKKARNWLKRFDVAHEFIDYREQPIAAAQLRDWAAQAGGWDKLINRSSTTWRGLPEARKSPQSDPEWTLLVKEYPALVRRPVMLRDDATISVGFSDNHYKSLFIKN